MTGSPPPPSARPGPGRPPTLRPPTPSRPDEGELGDSAPPPKNSLDEVERALSLLDGRHHDTVRVQRQTQLAATAKRAADAEAVRKADRAQRTALIVRGTVGVLAAVLLAGGGFFEFRRYEDAKAIDGALETLAKPYLAAGWKADTRSFWQARDHLEGMTSADSCSLVLGSTEPGKGGIVVERVGAAPATLTAVRSAAYCACADERVVARTEGDPKGGVLLLHRDARDLGGNEALGFVSPRPDAIAAAEPCQTSVFDRFVASGKAATAPDPSALPVAVSQALLGSGFTFVTSASPSSPFAVVPGSKDTCFFAATTSPGDILALRRTAGERPFKLSKGDAPGFGWCTHTAEPMTVFHDARDPGAGSLAAMPGTVAIYRVEQSVVAGTLGLAEVLAKAGFANVPLWVKPTEMGWDASAPLLASGIAVPDIALPSDGRAVAQSRVVSLTIEGAQVTPIPDDIDRYVCAPALDTSPRDALCVQSSALAWKGTSGVFGAAESPLPFWMDIMTEVDDRRGLALELRLLTLSRHLAAEHFEATARTFVSEEREGVRVVGREGDDRIIAIGLLSTAPWVLPYTDGVAWTLEGPPRTIPITPGQELHLVTRPWVNVPPEVRRTVVFRHQGSR